VGPEKVEEEEEERDDSWRQSLEEDTSEGDASGSGEDSDESTRGVDDTRLKSDMDALMRQSRHSTYGRTSVISTSASVAQDEEGTPERTREADGSSANKDDTPTSVQPKKGRGSLLGRLSSGLLGRGSAAETGTPGEGLARLLKEEGSAKHDDSWYQRWSFRLSKDGLACTKVATNGKPYERRLHVDSRNLTIEIRGGRGGATGVLLDDLVDIRQGLESPEFVKFCARFKKEIVPPELSKRAIALQTPTRTFSFLFSSESQRDTIGHFVVYLLRMKNRGVMADGPVGQSERAPKDGQGKVKYPNRSSYEGQFQNFMRHGQGTLTLSDGTSYECEWKHDERNGKGKEYWADGTIFVGTYVKGMRSGHGIMTWPEGSKYSGQFERGKANGEGELVRTDGSVYLGTFQEDCMAGDGRMQWKDGVSYVGQFVGNRREGFGKMMWTSGRWKSYEGYWKEGVQHGHGALVDQHDQEFSGTFVSGKLERWDDDV
jgi:hypothetical protein